VNERETSNRVALDVRFSYSILLDEVHGVAFVI
jgi:hypothetical protein